MKTVAKSFALFAHMMDEARVYRNPELDFRTVCRILKVSPVDFDEFLVEETGYKGEEIMRCYRKIDKIN